MIDGVAMVALWLVVGVLCLIGLALSCLSISGTWLVTAAAVLLAWTGGSRFPGWGTPITFAIISALVEGLEAIAGWLGVTSRGGSKWAGVAAMAGGLLGAIAGTAIPIPLLGSLFGMLAGSFASAYYVEWKRLGNTQTALHIAKGALLARLVVLLLKVTVTLGMIGFLAAGLLLE